MNDILVLQQLQDGLIEFETAFSLIATRAGGKVADPVVPPAEALVRRSSAGRVQLPDPATMEDGQALPLHRPPIALVPLELASLDDGYVPRVPSPRGATPVVGSAEVVAVSFARAGVA